MRVPKIFAGAYKFLNNPNTRHAIVSGPWPPFPEITPQGPERAILRTLKNGADSIDVRWARSVRTR